MTFYGEIYILSRRVRRRSTRLSWLCTPKPEILHTGHVNTLQDLDKSFLRIDTPPPPQKRLCLGDGYHSIFSKTGAYDFKHVVPSNGWGVMQFG